jgi:hypothetical protein
VRIQEVALAVPDWVRAQLLPGEAVLGKTSAGGADYFATDRRLLRFKGKSSCDAAPYGDVSITLQRYGWGWHLVKLFAVVFSLAIIALGVLMLWGPTIGDTDYGGPPILALVAFGAAALFIWTMINYRFRYYRMNIWRANKGTSDQWLIERPRFAIGNAALDRFAAVVKERSRSFGGAQETMRSRPKPRLLVKQPGLKPQHILAVGALVVGLMWLIGVASDADLYRSVPGGYEVREEALLLGLILFPLAGGFIVGFWTNWRGAAHGAFAGILVVGGAWAYGIYRFFVEQPELGELTTSGFVLVLLAPPFVGEGLAAAAGFLGERLRG